MVYEPREDSFLLAKQVRKHAFGRVLDIGTGSGIQAVAAAKKAKSVLAVDIDKKTVAQCKKIKNKKIKFLVSDLFSNVKGKFDTIIFNPPYLPQDKDIADKTIYGGKKGYETIERFLANVNEHLAAKGKILLLFSSYTKPAKVLELISNHLFDAKLVATNHVFFEELYVYVLQKSKLLHELEAKGVSDMAYFAHGKRGVIYTGKYKGKKIAIKTKRPGSEAVGRIRNEAKVLKVLNKKGIGPKLSFSSKQFVAYEFLEGEFIRDFLLKASKKELLKVLKEVFRQCFLLDKIGINKEEMIKPYKHIIISKKITMIDFERAHKSKKPKNVTQFCQYILMNAELLTKKGIKLNKHQIINAARQYSKKRNVNLLYKQLF